MAVWKVLAHCYASTLRQKYICCCKLFQKSHKTVMLAKCLCKRKMKAAA